MAVSKRIRFEVLKRDNHACRYCGAAAPEVKLAVDHVMPIALGGTDEPSNLVTACVACNSGKASTAPDANLIEDVRQDALRHAELSRQAYAVMVENIELRNDYIDDWAEFYDYPVPESWRDSIGRWFDMGVPLEVLTDAAERAGASRKTFRGTDRFAYMCGIVWGKVRMVDEIAEKYRAIEGRFFSSAALDDFAIDQWRGGWANGYRAATRDLAAIDHLAIVVDGGS